MLLASPTRYELLPRANLLAVLRIPAVVFSKQRPPLLVVVKSPLVTVFVVAATPQCKVSPLLDASQILLAVL